MSAKLAIMRKAFRGNTNALGKVDCIIKAATGAPAMAAKVGTLCWVVADSNAYICTVATGTWVKINA